MSRYFFLIATSPSGATAAIKAYINQDKLLEDAADLIATEHTVRLFEGAELEFETSTRVTVNLSGGSDAA